MFINYNTFLFSENWEKWRPRGGEGGGGGYGVSVDVGLCSEFCDFLLKFCWKSNVCMILFLINVKTCARALFKSFLSSQYYLLFDLGPVSNICHQWLLAINDIMLLTSQLVIDCQQICHRFLTFIMIDNKFRQQQYGHEIRSKCSNARKKIYIPVKFLQQSLVIKYKKDLHLSYGTV